MTEQYDWREQAMIEVLRARTNEGSGLDALLREVRIHQPTSATHIVDADRLQLLRFLETQTHDVRSLLQASSQYEKRDETHPYLAWYAVQWEALTLEIVLAPYTYMYSNEFVCIAPNKVQLEQFVRALKDFAIRPAGRSLRYSEDWENAPELDNEIGKVAWDDLVLPSSLLQSVREAIEGFAHHRDAFRTLGFPWRRGILLIGPPGTGKTMVCKAAAAALPQLPFLYVRDFRSPPEQDAIETIFERARRLAPCILAFEDIDGLVQEANRTMFLNELDGFNNNEGLLIIASSNHPGKIDEALLKRPSRFGRVFHLGLPALAERREFCRRVLSRSTLVARMGTGVDVDALAQKVAERSDGFTPAYLKEVFVAAALQRAQAGAMTLDEAFVAAVLQQVGELRQYLRQMRDPEAFAEMSNRSDLPMGFRR